MTQRKSRWVFGRAIGLLTLMLLMFLAGWMVGYASHPLL